MIASAYTYGLPTDGIKDPIRDHIKDYLDLVINQEWPKQQQGKMDQKAAVVARTKLLEINRALATFNPQNAGQANIHAQMFKTLNDLFTARRSRVQAANGHVPESVWAIILLGTAASIGYTYFFGMNSLYMHLAITGSVAASLALVILLIVVMDYPFRGELSIGIDAYQAVRSAINNADLLK